MVTLVDTINVTEVNDGEAVSRKCMFFVGLSTDTKPTVEFGNTSISNGSLFFEMDEVKFYMYDESQPDWVSV